MKILLALLIVLIPLQMQSCDSKKTHTDEKLEELSDVAEKRSNALLEQLDSETGLINDTEHLEEMANIVDELAEESSSEEAVILKDQAAAMREIQELSKPYTIAVTKLMESGGIDPSTFSNEQSYIDRLKMIDDVQIQNDYIEKEYPALQRRLRADPRAEARILRLVSQIRQSDREFFEHSIKYIKILQSQHGAYEVFQDGTVYFQDDIEDSVLNAFNYLSEQILILSEEQADYQRKLIQMSQP